MSDYVYNIFVVDLYNPLYFIIKKTMSKTVKVELSEETYKKLKDQIEEDCSEGYELADEKDGMPYVIVRTYSAGVFAGYLKKRKGKEGTMLEARRLWSWSGAASLSQLATDGTSNPQDCKFPCKTEGDHDLTEIIEVIRVTKKAQKSINQVAEWKT